MAQPDPAAAFDLSFWIPLFTGVIASPVITFLWALVPELRRRRRLIRIAEVWTPPSASPSRSELLLNDMLESEVEMLWWQRERAYWRAHDPTFAYSVPFFIWLGIVLAAFGWQIVQAFVELGIGYGLFACFLTFVVWSGPAAIIQWRGERRREYRLMRGNVPRTAEQIAELRDLHQQNKLQAPSYKELKVWLSSHRYTRFDWQMMQENAASWNENRSDMIRSIQRAEAERQERIRRLLEPPDRPTKEA